MDAKKLVSWMSPVALATLMVGAGAVTAVPAISETLEVGPQESQESQEPPGKNDHHWRGRRGRGGPGHGPRGGMGFMRMFRELDLSPEQKKAIREGIQGQHESLKDAHQQLYTAKNLLQEASLRGEDDTTLQQYAEAVGKAEAHAALLKARQHAAAVKVLDSDQRARLEELHAEAEQRREEFKERREQYREERLRRMQDQEL